MSKPHSILHTFSEFVVRRYRAFLLVFAALMILSVFTMGWVSVENDVAQYLPDSYEAKQGLNIMEREFVTYGSARILIKNTDDDGAREAAERLLAVKGVRSCEYEINEAGSALFDVSLDSEAGAEDGKATVALCKKALDGEDFYLRSDEGYSLSEQIGSEIGKVIAVIAVIVVLTLLFTSSTYAEVPVLLLVFISAALINKGTDFLLGTISFISNSVSIVLQLALSVDYAIVFCNAYKRARRDMPIKEAVAASLESSVVIISASSLTTVAGLAAMTFMQFGLGRDMGFALIKAICISLLSVFLFMPGLLILFGKAMDKTAHRSFVPKISWLGKFAHASRNVVAPLFVLAVVAAYLIFGNVDYAYSETALHTAKRNDRQIAQEQISAEYGETTTLAVVLPRQGYDAEKSLSEDLAALDGVSGVTGIAVTDVGGGYRLGDTLNYREFAALAGTGETEAQALLALYAAENGSAAELAQNAESYRAPVIELFLLLHDKAESGIVELTEEQSAMVAELYEELSHAREQLEGVSYDRVILTLSVPDDGEETCALLDDIHAVVARHYDGDYYLVGDAMSAYGFRQTFGQDNTLVSVMSILMVMLVLLFTFRSFGMPLLLTLVIQGSIWINFALAAVMGDRVLFMVYLIASAIQMGSNVDYAIVVASHYTEARKALDPQASVIEALNDAFPTIITSGTMLVSAGLLIGGMVSSGAVAGMGHFVGFGSLITLGLVMFVLPQLLLFGDGFVAATTLQMHRLLGQSARPILRRAGAAVLALLAALAAAGSVMGLINASQEKEQRVAADRRMISSADELYTLACELDAQKEDFDLTALSFAESVVTDTVGGEKLSGGWTEYNAGSARLSSARAQYESGSAALEQGKSDYAAAEAQLAEAKVQYAEGEARLARIKPLYDAVYPQYRLYCTMKAEYDEAASSGDMARAALLWPGVEAQRLVYENALVGGGYSLEGLMGEYASGRAQADEAAIQIAEAETQLAAARQQLDAGQAELDSAAAQINSGEAALSAAGQELMEGDRQLTENREKLAGELEEISEYSDRRKRLESGVRELSASELVSSRLGDTASLGEICGAAKNACEDDIAEAQREYETAKTINTALLLAICAVCAGGLLLKLKKKAEKKEGALSWVTEKSRSA